MSDAQSLLLSVLGQCRGETVFVADENCLDFPFASIDKSTRVLSNRCDVAAQAKAAGLPCRFSDYDAGHWQDTPADHLVYRISKEKPVVHHIANQAIQLLKDGGKLWLIGGKQEGIKTFAKTIGELFACAVTVEKEGWLYLARIEKLSATQPPLDDKNYNELREIFAIGDQPVLSKPGLFGWNKIDVGSELLASYLGEFLKPFSPDKALTLLDLGCGYGYLSLMANRERRFEITATDNCAAALIACEANFKLHQLEGKVIADDCGAGIGEQFDILLCNPPFHQGFQQERKLTEKFLGNTRRLLAKKGRALFVVNQFVPLETLAKPFFGHIHVAVTAKGFKLIELAHSSR